MYLQNSQLSENSLHEHTFVKKIRGTVAYWKNTLANLLAKLKTLGPPCWFLTLSADDLHWSDCSCLLLMDNPYSEANATELLRKNPVMICKQFVRRWKSFMRWLKKSKALGTITDSFERVEFQHRGSAHLHIFLWTSEKPDLNTREGREKFPDFIDKYISTCIPEDDSALKQLVLKYQIHKHTATCLKGNRKRCRFNFPRSPALKTQLCYGVDPYYSKKFYVTKRRLHEKFVNPYNPAILSLWKANMDLQFVGNAFAVASYVCDYICKSEPKELQQSVQTCIDAIRLSPDMSARRALSKLGTVILTKRSIGAQEAVFRVLGLPLVSSSRKVVFINCRPENERFRLLKQNIEVNQLQSNGSDLSIYHMSIIDAYQLRPQTDEFNKMSLARFASWYEMFENETSNSQRKGVYKLQGCSKSIRKRTKCACIRSTYVPQKTNTERYYFRLLMLYFPFRKEQELLGTKESYESAFAAKKDQLDINAFENQAFGEEVERAVQQLRILRSENIADLASHLITGSIPDSSDEQLETEVEFFSHQLNLSSDCDINQSLSDSTPHAATANTINLELRNLHVYSMTDTEFAESIKSLSSDQARIFAYVKTKLSMQISGLEEPLHAYISGEAGTGKSFLINVVNELCLRTFNQEHSVIKCAFSGVAAFNIKGITMHKAFLLPVDHKNLSDCQPLEGEILKQCRAFYKNVKVIIIDEISFVSYRTLQNVDRRLKEFKNNQKLFGGVNILCFGDFAQLRPVDSHSYLFQDLGKPFHLFNDVFNVFILHQNMRQSNDSRFSQLLCDIRLGNATDEDVKLIKSRIDAHKHDSAFQHALWIYPTRNQVHEHNNSMLQKLKDYKIFEAEDVLLNKTNFRNIEALLPTKSNDTGGLEKYVKLRVNCRVMLMRNISLADGLVNGAIGSVVAISMSDSTGLPNSVSILFDHNKTVVAIEPITVKFFGKKGSIWERTQIPVVLCWASTCHKVQGLTLSKVVIDLGSKVFTKGMGYVAMSRVRRLEDLSICDFHPKSLQCSSLVQSYYASINESNDKS